MAMKYDNGNLFIEEVQGHHRRYLKIVEFTQSSTKAAGVMFIAAVIALIVANSPIYDQFLHFWHAEVMFGFAGSVMSITLAHLINDVFMAIFFLLVGLEIKYEMTAGELTNLRQALLPIVAAMGGVLVPIGIYLLINMGHTDNISGWGVPSATDIAFALGILALLGSRVPSGVRVFLSTLAVADDIIAILVIAIFYGQTPQVSWLIAAAVVMVGLILLNRLHVYSIAPYMLLGCVLWYCVFMSGVHSTIAGVLLAFTIPASSRVNVRTFAHWSGSKLKKAEDSFEPNTPLIGQHDYLHHVSELSKVASEVLPPAVRIEHGLYPWVYFGILPLFALTNADVSLTGVSMEMLFSNAALFGVFFGLLLGKPIGITLFSFLVVKLKLASLPERVTWAHLIGASILGGVGFTMAIFVANLAYTSDAIINMAKVGILSASALAGIIGFVFLFMITSRAVEEPLRENDPRISKD